MSWLRFLYPRRWWARYGEEFLALVEERGLTASDLMDIVLGALDAHICDISCRLRAGHLLSYLLFLVGASALTLFVRLGRWEGTRIEVSMPLIQSLGSERMPFVTLLAILFGLFCTVYYLSLTVTALRMLHDIQNELHRSLD